MDEGRPLAIGVDLSVQKTGYGASSLSPTADGGSRTRAGTASPGGKF